MTDNATTYEVVQGKRSGECALISIKGGMVTAICWGIGHEEVPTGAGSDIDLTDYLLDEPEAYDDFMQDKRVLMFSPE